MYNNKSFSKFLELISLSGLYPRVFTDGFVSTKYTYTQNNNSNDNSGIETKREKNGKGSFSLYVIPKRFVTIIQ